MPAAFSVMRSPQNFHRGGFYSFGDIPAKLINALVHIPWIYAIFSTYLSQRHSASTVGYEPVCPLVKTLLSYSCPNTIFRSIGTIVILAFHRMRKRRTPTHVFNERKKSSAPIGLLPPAVTNIDAPTGIILMRLAALSDIAPNSVFRLFVKRVFFAATAFSKPTTAAACRLKCAQSPCDMVSAYTSKADFPCIFDREIHGKVAIRGRYLFSLHTLNYAMYGIGTQVCKSR